MASASAPRGAASGAEPPSEAARIQKIALPARTAAKAPGIPQGRRTCPRRATSTMVSEVRPTSGSAKTLSAGRNAIRRAATPASDPKRAARGTIRRTWSPAKDSTSFSAPMATVTVMPIFQASMGSPVSSKAGPSTPKTSPNGEDGVDQVADQHARRGSRHHAVEHEIGGELEDADEQAREDDELGGVV